MSPQTFLVTAATGNVGAPVVHKLLARGHKVHALTSTRSSDRAKALEQAGAVIFEAEWRDETGLAAAIDGCHGVFLNPHPPKHEDFQFEPQYAKTILRLAEAAKVQIVVLNSVAGVQDITDWPEWKDFIERSEVFSAYWLNKRAVLHSVRASGLAWASIGGAQYFSNFATAKTIDFMQQRLREKPVGKLSGTSNPTTALPLVDPADVAELCVLALTGQARLVGRHIDVYGERRTTGQIAETMTKVLGKEIRVADDKVEFLPEVGRLNDTLAARCQFDHLKAYGVAVGAYEAWLEANKDEIKTALG